MGVVPVVLGHVVSAGVHGLDGSCSVCDRRAGDHTLDEWAVCFGAPAVDLPAEPVPSDVQALLRRQLKGLDGYLIADNVIALAAAMPLRSAGLEVVLPTILFDFTVLTPNGPTPVVKVAFLSTVETMPKFGDLVHDLAAMATEAAR